MFWGGRYKFKFYKNRYIIFSKTFYKLQNCIRDAIKYRQVLIINYMDVLECCKLNSCVDTLEKR